MRRMIRILVNVTHSEGFSSVTYLRVTLGDEGSRGI